MSKKSVPVDSVAHERSDQISAAGIVGLMRKQLVDAQLASSTSSGSANHNPPHSRAQLVGAVGKAPEAAARHQAAVNSAAAATTAVLPRHILIQGADGLCIPVLTHIAVRPFARILDVTIANTGMISLSRHVHRVDAFSHVFLARHRRAQFRSAVVKRRFEAGDLTASAPHIASSPRLPVAGAIYFPDISAAHLARIFDFCRTEWPSDRADAIARHAESQRHCVSGVEVTENKYIKSSRSFPPQITKYTFVCSFINILTLCVASQPSIFMPMVDCF
jgi:hypothetical protein